MKRIYFVGVLIIGLMNGALWAGLHFYPWVQIAERVQLGTVAAGGRVPVTVPLSNAGLSRLHIRDLGTSCGCASAKISSRDFSFGQHGHLIVEINAQVGSQTVFLSFKTNDPSRPEVTLPISYQGSKRF